MECVCVCVCVCVTIDSETTTIKCRHLVTKLKNTNTRVPMKTFALLSNVYLFVVDHLVSQLS